MPLPLVDVVATQPHYAQHLRPIWDALPPERKGTFFEGRMHTDPNRVALVAGWQDARFVGQVMPYFYVEHGAGQTYKGDPNPAVANHPSYASPRLDLHPKCIGFICPSWAVAERWGSPHAVAVGCPKLDQYRRLTPPAPEHVCFTFHWSGNLCPENGTAFWDWQPHLPALVDELKGMGAAVFGHAHPRWEGVLWPLLERAGMSLLRTEREVFHHVGTLVADNTSLIPEMASLQRFVMLLNAPHYRRDVEHGGRFWEWPQLGIWDIDPLPDNMANWLANRILNLPGDDGFGASERLAEMTYAYNDAHAAQRAASFIVERLFEV